VAVEDRVQERLSVAMPKLDLLPNDVQIQALVQYLGLLQRWNGTYNLTAVRDPAQMLTHHVLDCLAVVAPLRRRLLQPDSRLLDVGSGGGLPGIILAIMLPELQVSCVDAVGKKAAFIRQAGLELRLRNLTALHARVEDVNDQFDVISSRAFATLAEFCHLTRALLAPAGQWMAMKAKNPMHEMAQLPNGVKAFHVEQLQVPGLDAERCVVWLCENCS
jgi:16S rRNA (guanine527-N7)-methyltransferase